MATLLEIAAVDLKKWPEGCTEISQGASGNLYNQNGNVVGFSTELADDRRHDVITESGWQSARAAYLKTIASSAQHDAVSASNASETQAQQAQAAISYEQKLWDDVAKLRYDVHLDRLRKFNCQSDEEARSNAAQIAFSDAYAFMAERAKCLGTTAKPDTTAYLLAALEEAGHALNRWGPAAGERYLRMVQEAKEGGAA